MIPWRKDKSGRRPAVKTQKLLGPKLSNDFMELRLTSAHPAFQHLEAVRNDDGSYSAVPPQKVEPASTETLLKIQTDSFREALQRYRISINADVTAVLDPKFEWKDAVEALQGVEQKLKNQKTRPVSLDKCCDNFVRNQKQVDRFMKMLPRDSWQGSLVCGGFKILFDAVASVGKVRQDVINVLEQIPVTIRAVYDLVGVYGEDLLREEFVAEIFVSMLDLLEYSLGWYTRKTWLKLVDSLASGDEFALILSHKFARFEKLGRRIDQRATVSLHKEVQATRKSGKETEAFLQQLLKMLNDQEASRAAEQDAEDQLRVLLQQEAQDKSIALSALRKSLQRSLSYDRAKTLLDYKRCLSTRPFNFPDARQKAEWIIRTPEVRRWWASSESELLIVNANEELHGAGDSAVSMLSAMLLHSIKVEEPTSTRIYWFASCNIQLEPTDMASALLAQLLTRGEAMPPTQKMLHFVEQDFSRLQSVIDLLRAWLRAQLLMTSVYCICDSVSCYEDSRRRAGLLAIYGMLSDLVEEHSGEHQLKVMLTSPKSCVHIGSRLDGRRGLSRVLFVPERV